MLRLAVSVMAVRQECLGPESRHRLSPSQIPAAILGSALGLRTAATDPARLLHSDPLPVAVLSYGGPPGLQLRYRQQLGNASAPAYLASLRHNTSWTPPFWDCTLRMSGVGLYYPLDKVVMDQCNEDYPASPRCDPQTIKCESVAGYDGDTNGFQCTCLPGYVSPLLFNRSRVESQNIYDWDPDEELVYRCSPNCSLEANCLQAPHFLLTTFVICVQVCFMLVTIVIAIVIFQRRKCKPVATGMWTILETLLFGIFLLYASMLPQAFKPSIQNCIIIRWIREIGFIICYGGVILKLYRILMEFRTRRAHRWIVKDKDLLKYLCGMVMVMLTYLMAWTATNLNFIKEGFSIVTVGVTSSGVYFQTCKPLWWDYVTQTGEVVILLFGLHLGLAARNALLQYIELRYLLGAVIMETVVSIVYYVSYATLWRSLHPNHAFIASFLRCHLTSTFALGLIFTPLILYHHKPVRDSRHHLTHEPSDVCRTEGIYGEIDIAEVNLSEMSPEEIREELKRLYTQLEVLRNKSLCLNNPHISKRRGGRKVAHRRFSLQKKGSREKALQQKKRALEKAATSEIETCDQEVSRTPEDSVCSAEGPSAIYNDGPSTYSELGGFGTPNLTRKS